MNDYEKIYVVDIGSEINKNLAWICDDGSNGNKLKDLKLCINEHLARGYKIYIGFESPLYFDVFDSNVNRQRLIDNGRPWSAGSGASVTVTGMAQIFWLFNSLYNENSTLKFEILTSTSSSLSNIYIWEAFVAKDAKSTKENVNPHIEDCKTALAHYQSQSLSEMKNEEYEEGIECVSLIGAILMRINRNIDAKVLTQRPIVIKPNKPYDDYKGFQWQEK